MTTKSRTQKPKPKAKKLKLKKETIKDLDTSGEEVKGGATVGCLGGGGGGGRGRNPITFTCAPSPC